MLASQLLTLKQSFCLSASLTQYLLNRDFFKQIQFWFEPKEKPSFNMNGIQKELYYFEQPEVRSPLIDKLFFALCSGQHTSMQIERKFLLTGTLVSKLRTRSTDVLRARTKDWIFMNPNHHQSFCFYRTQIRMETFQGHYWF